jgi:hypothetical protein
MATEAGFTVHNFVPYKQCSKFTYDDHYKRVVQPILGHSTKELSLISFKVTRSCMVCNRTAVFIQGSILLACSLPEEGRQH